MDDEGKDIPTVIATAAIEENENNFETSMGMNCIPEIMIEDVKNRLPVSEFCIPLYSQALINVIDLMETTLKEFPLVTDFNKKRFELFDKTKQKLLDREDLHEKLRQDLNSGKNIRYIHLFGNDCGKFAGIFSMGYDSDPHINVGSPCINLNIAEIIEGKTEKIKKLLSLRIINAWLFFCDLKHHDPRLGYDKDTISLRFAYTEDP